MRDKSLYILQVRNLRKHRLCEWVNLHTLVNLKDYKNPEMALEVTLSEFSLRKERENLPMEFRFVKIKIDTSLNVVYPKIKNGEVKEE